MPGVEAAALRRAIASLLVTDPSHSDYAFRFAAAHAASGDDAIEKRVWRRWTWNGSEYFVSLNPPEFRADAKLLAEGDVVLDLALHTETIQLSQIVDDFATDAVTRLPGSPEIAALAATARQVVREMPNCHFVGGVALFDEASHRAPDAGPDEWASLVNGLYRNCLHAFLMPNDRFTLCMVLLRLQKMTAHWIEEGCYADPWPYLCSFVAQLRGSPQLHGALTELGNGMYANARRASADALASLGQDKFCRKLLLAYHYYYAAAKVAGLTAHAEIPLKFDYKEVIAEEGCATTYSGLLGGVLFFLEDPKSTLSSLAESLFGGSDTRIERLRRQLASPFVPRHSKWFGRLLLAGTLTHCGGQHLGNGLAELLTLERTTPELLTVGLEFEASWLEYSLISAHRASRDQQNLRSYVARHAARLIFSYPDYLSHEDLLRRSVENA